MGREPLLKIVHFLRAMEYMNNDGQLLAFDDIGVGQAPFGSKSVFNFYKPDYQPATLAGTDLVAPEFQIFTAPFAIGFLNGMMSLIDNGLTSCGEGFGAYSNPCHQGAFNFSESSTTEETLAELDVLLTGGRTASLDLVRAAYESAAPGEKLKVAQKAM